MTLARTVSAGTGCAVRAAARSHSRLGPTRPWFPVILLIAVVLGAARAQAQLPGADADTRAAALARVKAEKATAVHVYEPNKAEIWLNRAENLLLTGGLRFHPFFESAYAGGGFTLGAGYRRFVSSYNTVDLRGSITLSGYKRIEAEFLAPRLFNRRAVLSVVGGWREATQVGFYGIGTTQTSSEDRANYSFTQPYVSGRIEVWPSRRLFVVGGGLEYSQWDQGPGSGSAPSVEEIYAPETLPGLGANPTYLHAEGSAALDWRTSAGYSRRGGAYGVTVHNFEDHDSALGFRRVDYDAIQHIPLLRDAWVLSLHGRIETDDEEIANRLFWALGYNQVETFLTRIDPARLQIDATVRRPSGARTPFTRDDLDAVLERAARNADGTYEAAAARQLPGKLLGPFRYEGTRPDDPNDIVPHEHRRELRALRVFGAWTNLTDLKAGNTLDSLVSKNGRSVVKHYLQDVGSTFGMGANGPHDWDEGWEYFYQGNTTRRRLLSFGFALSPWQTAPYASDASVGRFEGDRFDPTTWKPHTATTAYIEMRPDDAFWAAQRVMAFTDDLIRAIVKTGQLTDAAAEQRLAEVLIKRRDAIGRAYLTSINPVIHPALSADGVLMFGNAAVERDLAAPPDSYQAVWSTFDNATGTSSDIVETAGRERMPNQSAPATKARGDRGQEH